VRDSLTRFVKTEAQRLGFSLVGVTPPDPPPHWSTFENWLKMGRHADMGYLAEERSLQRRADPHLILPGCRSILVLGFPYPKPSEITYTQEEKPSGRIAAYARGLDYHLVIPELLDRLVLGMQTRLGYDFAFRPGWGGSARIPALFIHNWGLIFSWLRSCWGSTLRLIRLLNQTAAGTAPAACKPVPRAAFCPGAYWTPAAAYLT
jgi:hypothetical protein